MRFRFAMSKGGCDRSAPWLTQKSGQAYTLQRKVLDDYGGCMRFSLVAFLLLGCVRPYAQFTPLADAARAGDLATIRTLIAHGADPNEAAGQNHWSPLLHAIHKHQNASVEALLDSGANTNRLRAH